MNKTDLVAKVAEQTDLGRGKAAEAVDAVLEAVTGDATEVVTAQGGALEVR